MENIHQKDVEDFTQELKDLAMKQLESYPSSKTIPVLCDLILLGIDAQPSVVDSYSMSTVLQTLSFLAKAEHWSKEIKYSQELISQAN